MKKEPKKRAPGGGRKLKYGTKIITVIGQVKAIITATCIRGENITYEISYFQNGLSTTAWIHRIEFDIDESQKGKAGLVCYDKPNEDNYLMIELTQP